MTIKDISTYIDPDNMTDEEELFVFKLKDNVVEDETINAILWHTPHRIELTALELSSLQDAIECLLRTKPNQIEYKPLERNPFESVTVIEALERVLRRLNESENNKVKTAIKVRCDYINEQIKNKLLFGDKYND